MLTHPNILKHFSEIEEVSTHSYYEIFTEDEVCCKFMSLSIGIRLHLLKCICAFNVSNYF